LAGSVLAVVLVAGVSALVARQHALTTPSRVEISPANPTVFASGSVQLQARVIGVDAARVPPVSWSVVGPGSVTPDGIYTAGPRAGERALVVARAGPVSQAIEIAVKTPPGNVPLLLVACYEGNMVDIHRLPGLTSSGALLAPQRAAGIAVDTARRIAFVAADGVVMAVNLDSMTTALSPPVHGARFSGAVELAGGYFAATDNNAAKGAPGVYFFRVDNSGAPVLAGSVAAGETPEGIIAEPGGRTFYVTNVNSNEVLRYSFDGAGLARPTGRVVTGTRPFGIALDRGHNLLFVTDNDTPYLSGKRSRPGLETFALPSLRRVGTSLSTGSKEALPIGAAVDALAGRLFVTNEGDGDVVVYALPSLRRVATLQTGRFPWTPRVDEAAGRLYVPSANDNRVDVFDTRTLRAAAAPVATCAYPTNLAVAPRRSH
jgi:DNA-binding beta-propeller fold protein YncE